MTTPQLGGAPTEDEPTIGQLIADTTRDFSTLVRDEIELAQDRAQGQRARRRHQHRDVRGGRCSSYCCRS